MRAIVLLFISINAHAFPTTSHYRVATEPRELALESSLSHWDPEASSDFITYQRPLEWDIQWWRQPKTFDLSLGSISSKQFLTYQRLKLTQPLTENVELRVQFLEERDFAQDRREMPLELKFKVKGPWSISLFGMPSLYKAEDDVGMSLFYETEKWELRASGVWGDFQRNKRRLQTDEWSEAPFGGTVSARYLHEDAFFNAELHHEPRSQRSDLGAPITDLNYDSFSLTAQKNAWGTRLLLDRAYHSDRTADIARARLRSLNQLEYNFILGPHQVKPGLNLFYQEHRESSRQVVIREVLPTFWLQGFPRTKEWGTRTLSVGYDADISQRQEADVTDTGLEHRLNVKLDMRFAKAGQLALFFTFDLDRFGSGETWEGGAGQFRLDF